MRTLLCGPRFLIGYTRGELIVEPDIIGDGANKPITVASVQTRKAHALEPASLEDAQAGEICGRRARDHHLTAELEKRIAPHHHHCPPGQPARRNGGTTHFDRA